MEDKKRKLRDKAALVIDLANVHLNDPGVKMRSSAELCVQTASEYFDKEDFENATRCAIRSLAYSVGILHEHYQIAKRGT